EILGGRRIRGPVPGHRARLRLSLSRRLDRRDAEEIEETLRLVDHPVRQAGGLHRLGPGGREVADLDGLPPFSLRPTLDFPAGLDRPGLQPWRLSVEYEDR